MIEEQCKISNSPLTSETSHYEREFGHPTVYRVFAAKGERSLGWILLGVLSLSGVTIPIVFFWLTVATSRQATLPVYVIVAIACIFGIKALIYKYCYPERPYAHNTKFKVDGSTLAKMVLTSIRTLSVKRSIGPHTDRDLLKYRIEKRELPAHLKKSFYEFEINPIQTQTGTAADSFSEASGNYLKDIRHHYYNKSYYIVAETDYGERILAGGLTYITARELLNDIVQDIRTHQKMTQEMIEQTFAQPDH